MNERITGLFIEHAPATQGLLNIFFLNDKGFKESLLQAKCSPEYSKKKRYIDMGLGFMYKLCNPNDILYLG